MTLLAALALGFWSCASDEAEPHGGPSDSGTDSGPDHGRDSPTPPDSAREDGTADPVDDGGDDSRGAVVEEHPECHPNLSSRDAYEATIRWTSWGIPHIAGSDVGNAAFGQAYAMARDHICTIADQVLMVRSERARTFGAGPRMLMWTATFP